MKIPARHAPLAARTFFALAMIVIGLLFIAMLGLLLARSVLIDEGQNWSGLAKAGLLRGAV
jgi:hypothetical protein